MSVLSRFFKALSLVMAGALLSGCMAPPDGGGGWTPPTGEQIRLDMDRLLCDVRCDAGLSRLEYSEKLTEAAKAHAHDLATNIGVLQHEGSDGSTVAERVTRTGYEWQKVAENIAVGYTTTSAVMDGWMNSPPHRANNLLPGLTHFGAAAEGDDKYWVLVLAEEK